MSRVRTWLWGERKLQNYFRALIRHLPSQCRNLSLLPPTSRVNYSAYLSSYLQNNIHQYQDRSFRNGAFLPSKVPRQRRGTFSLSGDDNNILISEFNIIPTRHRAGLIRLIDKYRSRVYLFSIFKPKDFNFNLAEKSDIYCIQKNNWQPVVRELKNSFTRILARKDNIPTFPPRLTLREKLVMRILFRYRQRFVNIEEISSYIYGRRMTRNIHASEVIISNLRHKLNKLSGRNSALPNVRNYGYRVADEVWEKIQNK